jgi:CO dehydrogenase maturation factor
MSVTLAVAGKGGTGKTTLSALMIRALQERGMTPILAVDADPNANLGEALGLTADLSIGRLQAETLKQIHSLPAGVPLSRHLEYELHQAIVEGEGIDLLVMGHGEGPGCYCAVNHILRRYIESLRSSYRCTILDNEAGMEHLSRRVSHGIDLLLVVSDASPTALRSAGRIAGIADDLELEIGRRCLVLTNLRDDLSDLAAAEVDRTGLELVARIPFDEEMYELTLAGRPIAELPPEAVSLTKVSEMLDTLLQKEEVA